MQLPPPVHGVSVMNQLIKNSPVINTELQCDYINLATAKNINDLQKKGIRKYLLTVSIMFKAIFKMATRRYDYVYITIFPFGAAFYKDSLIVLLARLFRQKPLLHLHTHGFKRTAESSVRKKRFYTFVFKNTEVICLSDLLLEDIETIYTGKVYILPNGISQVNFSNTYNNNQEPFTLLYLSNLIKGKGILILIAAVEIIKQKGYTFVLRVVGPEGDISYKMLKELVEQKQLTGFVELIGPKFGEDKYNEFKNAGMFLLPSNYDTFGLVFLEAMQFGVPCISTNIGGIPDVLGDGRGIIIKEITSGALAEAIEYLLTHPEARLKMSADAFDYYPKNFTVEVFEQRLKNILTGHPDTINNRLVKSSV